MKKSSSLNPLAGILYRLAAVFLFALMALMIKMVSARYPIGEIVFARSFFAILPIFFMLAARGEFSSGLKMREPLMVVARIAAGVMGMFCNFSALYYLSLPDATAIGFAAPLITVAFAALLLKEDVRTYRWSAVAIGLGGVVLMLSPHMQDSMQNAQGRFALLGALLALLGAVFTALAMISIRKMAVTEKTSAIVFYFSAGSALAGAATALFGWTMPTLIDALILFAIGFVGGVAQILLTQSYHHAEASLVAPFDYLALLWAIFFGWLFFADLPSTEMLSGAAIVIAAGIFVIMREHYLVKVHRKEQEIADMQIMAK